MAKIDITNNKSCERGNVTLGRPEGSRHHDNIQILKKRGYTQSQTARILGVSISTVKRNWRQGIIE
ncbi:helix-turn-helix domain-containing protein [Yersinia enterocolitica]